MQSLGNPQDTFSAIHIAGTSGKGTVCFMIEALLDAHQQTTGALVSPHVYDIKERVHIRSELCSIVDFYGALSHVRSAYQALTRQNGAMLPSYFDVITATGFVAIARANIRYGIIETGMGGRFDATNLIHRLDKVAVLTTIGRDHTHILGSTLAEIAWQKAGIITTKQTVYATRQHADVLRVFRLAAKKRGASLHIVSPTRWSMPTALPGLYNRKNAGIAIAVVRGIARRDGWKFSPMLARRAIASLVIPGRFETYQLPDGKTVIFDGAHNLQKITALASVIATRYSRSTTGVVFASSKDDVERSIRVLSKIASSVVLTAYHNQILLGLKPPTMLEESARRGGHIWLFDGDTVCTHILQSSQTVWVITGSFYILSEIKKKLML